MLQHVERHDAVLGVELRNQRKPDPAAPVEQDQRGGSAEHHRLLQPLLPGDGPVQAHLCCEIHLVIVASGKHNVPEEQKTIQKVPLVANLGRAHFNQFPGQFSNGPESCRQNARLIGSDVETY